MTPVRPALALLAPSGVLAGHAVGHLVAPGHAVDHAVDHGYLGMVVAVAGPLTLLALAWAGARGRQVSRSVPLGALVAAQCLLFGGQEAIEHLIAGHGFTAFLQSPAVWVGLAAQVATALALVLLMRAAATAGTRLPGTVAPRTVVPGLPVSAGCHAARTTPVRSRLAAAVSSRGPPALSPA